MQEIAIRLDKGEVSIERAITRISRLERWYRRNEPFAPAEDRMLLSLCDPGEFAWWYVQKARRRALRQASA